MRGIVRLAVLVLWAAVVFGVGGWATKHGVGQVTAGCVELLALVIGVALVMVTPMWGRSVQADRDRELV